MSTAPLNSSYILFNDIPLNKTALDLYNYHLYPNGTASNNTKCWLVFKPYVPVMLPNGTFLHADICDSPINAIKSRGGLGIAFAIIFLIQLAFVMASLNKHGRAYLPQEHSYKVIGRRWQYYWSIITLACGVVAGVMAIDLDRFYVQGAPVTLTNIFFYMMGVGALGIIWETTRNWYSFQERLCTSYDRFYFPPEDLRSKVEFYQPMVVYLWIFLTFFLAILRSWDPIRRQYFWIYEDPRFQASAAFGLVALITISATFIYGIQNYRINNPPAKIPLMICLGLVMYSYLLAAATEREISPLRAETSAAYIYPLGYLPVALIVLIQLICAWREENEDLIVKRVRRERDDVLGLEMRSDVRERERLNNPRNQAKGGDSERGVFVNKVDSLDSQASAYYPPLPSYTPQREQ